MKKYDDWIIFSEVKPLERLPQFINWLISKKANSGFEFEIDFSVLINLTALLESFCYGIMYDACGLPQVKMTSLKERLIEDVGDRLTQAQWKNYNEIFDVIFGVQLSSITDNETWKALGYLFQLRNNLIHGNSIGIKRYTEDNITFTNKYHDPIKYLLEKKLIDKKKAHDMYDHELLNDKVVNHFLQSSRTFLKAVIKNKLVRTRIAKRIPEYEAIIKGL